MTILRLAHISIEGLYVQHFLIHTAAIRNTNSSRVLDGRVRSLRDNLSKQWSELLYNGLYFSPERAFLQRQSIHHYFAMHVQSRTLHTDLKHSES